MRFGPIPVGDAEGAVLAHSVAVTGGRLRKGHVLTEPDLAALRAAGVAEVTAAVLEAGDVAENAAAAELAGALMVADAGLSLSKAFTGRTNLLATGPGVVVMDVAAVEAVNAIDPMITVATVPPLQQMAAGGMVATIKIISYAVPGAALKAACAAGRNTLRLASPQLRSARLIITEVPGGAGEKGREAIAARLAALDVDLSETVTVPHDTASLAQALSEATEELVLILTGSATSDPHDVGPNALRQAGGQVTRFGMPVDPGNLLFLGTLGPRPVIGLPGCARSPALNGADWVLARVVCGLTPGAGDIAAMGVGGLLKEIPTRPQPRRG